MARQFYREKFKPTNGAFGGTSKYNRKLKLQAELKAQLAEMEREKKEVAEKQSAKGTPTKKNVTSDTK